MPTTPQQTAGPAAQQPVDRQADADHQRNALLESERQANAQQPRNFKDDALTDKLVTVAPDGTGPTPTDSFDPQADRQRGSGNA